MDKRLENLRMYFPAEVTGAYLAVVSLLKANDVAATEQTGMMFWVAIALAVVNIAMYWKFYDVKNVLLHFVLTCGFLIWVLNIDTLRFKDLDYFGHTHVEVIAPVLLIFYSLMTIFIAAPTRTSNAPTS